MKNRFFITKCRFHTKKKNKLVITGCFSDNLIKENNLKILLDKKELIYVLEEKDLPVSGFKYVNGMPITKQYFLWIDLPENWKDSKKLEVINCWNSEQKKVAAISVKKLIENKLAKHVDKAELVKGGFRVVGWYITDGTAKVSFMDTNGNELQMQIKYKTRADVRRVYPENFEEEIVGFTAEYEGPIPKKVLVHFESSEKQADYIAPLLESIPEKVIRKSSNAFKKTQMYYQQNGAKETLERVVKKLTKKETLTYEEWLKRHLPGKDVLKLQRNYEFTYAPKISIVVPLYKTPENYLAEFIESVRNQTYANWELCLSDGSGENSPLTKFLQNYVRKDERIKVAYTGKQMQISENTNVALELATGDYIAFADHDDLLEPSALYECVQLLNTESDIDAIYTDEDKVDMNGKEHYQPHFKPDFNIDMLRSMNYICHLFVVKREIYEKVGKLNLEFDGAQDYDFVLRCVENSNKIKHIAKVLYHWRAHKDSTAENPESKNYAFIAGTRAIQAHYDRLGIDAKVEEAEFKGVYRTKYNLKTNPKVSVIIPNKDHVDDLDKCIRSLEEKNAYENMEYIVVENNSQEDRTFEYYKELESRDSKAKVVYWDGKGFNYPAINNYGVEKATGEYLLFLNNDTEIINSDCVEELLGFCMREDVGAVGARLFYEDGTIQHAGVIVGLGGVAGHAFAEYPHNAPGYFHRIVMAQNYSAVTAACMMMKRSVYEEVEGFDVRYAVAFNDVDLCLKVCKAGYRIVYNPYATLMHYESKSRGYEDTEAKQKRFNSEINLFKETWREFLEEGDPCYSPNLALDKNDFSINMYAVK